MQQSWLVSAMSVVLLAGCESGPSGTVQQGDVDEPPRWHFDRVEHGLGDMTLTDVYGRDDGTVVVVGWYGTILTNRVTEANPDGLWWSMPSHTTEHLTAVIGLDNGRDFNQHPRDGEMFAVGWNGTLLHYHPNPRSLTEPEPEDGRWQVVGGPGQGFTPRIKIDPFCPDYDGDGVLDDGGGADAGGPDGWWSREDTCVSGNSLDCDDNCRTSANGPYRPILDLNNNFGGGNCSSLGDSGACGTGLGCTWNTDIGVCVHPSPQNCLEYGLDGGALAATLPEKIQADGDANGVGTACQGDDTSGAIDEFRPTLFDVWASVHPSDSRQVVVVAVGENGALLSFVGPNAAQTPVPPEGTISARQDWIAQEQIPFWFSNDCPFLGVAPDPDGTCPGSGRLSPRCPAQCNVFKTVCDCPVDQGRCCGAGGADETNGLACSGPGCASPLGDQTGQRAADGCGAAAAGDCVDGCPNCFRRLDKTLRSIASDGNRLLAVGASGTVLYLDAVDDPTGVWRHPHCGAATPAPLDERPVLTAVSSGANGSFEVVGTAGAVVVVNPGSTGCDQFPRCGAPPAFLSGTFSRGAGRAYGVGDAGTFVELVSDSTNCIDNPAVVEIETDIAENLNAIWAYTRERMWFVGASGTVIRAGYYAGTPVGP